MLLCRKLRMSGTLFTRVCGSLTLSQNRVANVVCKACTRLQFDISHQPKQLVTRHAHRDTSLAKDVTGSRKRTGLGGFATDCGMLRILQPVLDDSLLSRVPQVALAAFDRYAGLDAAAGTVSQGLKFVVRSVHVACARAGCPKCACKPWSLSSRAAFCTFCCVDVCVLTWHAFSPAKGWICCAGEAQSAIEMPEEVST